MYRRMWSIVLLAALILAALPATAQTPTAPVTATAVAGEPVRVLVVGDDHFFFLDTYFPKLAASGDPAIGVAPGTAVVADWSLAGLWNDGPAFSPDMKALKAGKGQWDFGVIGIWYAYTGSDAKKFADWVPKYDEAFKKAGAQTVLTAPWPDQHDKVTAPEYTMVADGLAGQLGARVAPVALAVERVMRERPGLIQYVDESHLNAPGLYLMMCVLYATLFERSPEGLKYRLDDVPKNSDEAIFWSLPSGWVLSDEDAAYLQRVAWETVQEHNKAK